MAKRSGKAANGAGSVYRTKDGIWKASITVRNLDGTAKRIVRNAASQRAALIKLDELRSEFRDLSDNPGTITVDELGQRLLLNIEGEQSTIDHYRLMLRQHIGPLLGDRLCGSLSGLEIQEWIQALKNGGTGARTLQVSFTLLNRLFEWGKVLRVIQHNPCDGIRRPSSRRETIEPFSREEIRKILEGTKDDRLHAMYVLAITTGMRQGELFGLQWSDIDWKANTITISRQAKDYRGKVELKAPKTAAGIRTISVAAKAIEALSARRVLVETEGNAESPHVFCTARGCIIRRTTWGKRIWKPLLEDLAIPHRGAHHMRHTAATMMLSNGVPPHIVAGVLGHETAETVMSIYAHFISRDSSIAAAAMGKALTALW
jgi:integrase